MTDTEFQKPFDGAISDYYRNDAPKPVRKAIDKAHKDDILDPSYPHTAEMETDAYRDQIYDLQIALMRMQLWAQKSGARVAVVFEGRDAAG